MIQKYINKDELLKEIDFLYNEDGCWDYDYWWGISHVRDLVEDMETIDIEKISKQSNNILDLIGVGDLVELTIFGEENENGSPDPIGVTWYINDEIMLRNIKQQIKAGYMELDGILTNKQINSNMYRVGD